MASLITVHFSKHLSLTFDITDFLKNNPLLSPESIKGQIESLVTPKLDTFLATDECACYRHKYTKETSSPVVSATGINLSIMVVTGGGYAGVDGLFDFALTAQGDTLVLADSVPHVSYTDG